MMKTSLRGARAGLAIVDGSGGEANLQAMLLRPPPSAATGPLARSGARRSVVAVVLVISLAHGVGAAALDPALVARGFEHVTFDGKTPNRFTLTPDGAIVVESEQAVSLIQRAVEVDIRQTPILTWRWRVDQGVPPSDLTNKGGDDRSLAVYVTFPFRPGEATWLERMKRRMVEALAGGAAPGRVICYVFGGEGARGEIQPNPWFGDAGATVILRPASSARAEWFEERVDLAADYRRVFGGPPDDPTHLAISADGDDTGSRVRAVIDGLSFERP